MIIWRIFDELSFIKLIESPKAQNEIDGQGQSTPLSIGFCRGPIYTFCGDKHRHVGSPSDEHTDGWTEAMAITFGKIYSEVKTGIDVLGITGEWLFFNGVVSNSFCSAFASRSMHV